MADVSAGDGPPEVQESHLPHEMSAKEFALTRFSTLKPPMNHAPNPIRLVMLLSGKQWLFFLVGFLAWVCRYCRLSFSFFFLAPRSHGTHDIRACTDS